MTETIEPDSYIVVGGTHLFGCKHNKILSNRELKNPLCKLPDSPKNVNPNGKNGAGLGLILGGGR